MSYMTVMIAYCIATKISCTLQYYCSTRAVSENIFFIGKASWVGVQLPVTAVLHCARLQQPQELWQLN